jgi:hypothetical protein
MIEANENIDEVTMRRQQELSRAQESYRRAVSEGRMAVRPRQGAPTDGRAALVVAGQDGAGGQVATSAPLPEVSTSAALPVEVPPADPEAAWRHTRLAIAAGLVVLLLVVWIWQKKAGR